MTIPFFYRTYCPDPHFAHHGLPKSAKTNSRAWLFFENSLPLFITGTQAAPKEYHDPAPQLFRIMQVGHGHGETGKVAGGPMTLVLFIRPHSYHPRSLLAGSLSFTSRCSCVFLFRSPVRFRLAVPVPCSHPALHPGSRCGSYTNKTPGESITGSERSPDILPDRGSLPSHPVAGFIQAAGLCIRVARVLLEP